MRMKFTITGLGDAKATAAMKSTVETAAADIGATGLLKKFTDAVAADNTLAAQVTVPTQTFTVQVAKVEYWTSGSFDINFFSAAGCAAANADTTNDVSDGVIGSASANCKSYTDGSGNA